MTTEDKTALERFRRELEGTFRALSGQPKAQLAFPVVSLDSLSTSYYNPAAQAAIIPLPPEPSPAQLSWARGEADALALYLRHHDTKLPSLADGREFHTRLEETRCEALGATAMQGVAGNLRARWDARLRERGWHTATGIKDIPVAETASLLAYEAMVGEAALPPASAKILKTIGAGIRHKIAAELARLPEAMQNQAAYAHIVNRMAELLFAAEGEAESTETREYEAPPESATGGKPSGEENLQAAPKKSSAEKQKSQEAHSALEAARGNPEAEEQTSEAKTPGTYDRPHPQASKKYPPYRAFTTEFDRIVPAAWLATTEERRRLRAALDQKLEELHDITARLAAKLQRRLQATQVRSWDFHMEEGILDPAKLPAIIMDPAYPYPYKWEREAEYKHTVVSILLDNSGSMRGRPITMAAICADILARTLERCGVKVEVLGFTTDEWKGGKSRKAWLAAGEPSFPGRLNDLLHIVYKDANIAYRRARENFGVMMKEGLLKENIDGEAILWAYDRLLARPEARRILMVISDGAPVDDATLNVNGAGYLDRHLREVIHHIEHAHEAELIAIGIGHNVTDYYTRSVVIRHVGELGEAMVGQLAEMFDEGADWKRLRAKTR